VEAGTQLNIRVDSARLLLQELDQGGRRRETTLVMLLHLGTMKPDVGGGASRRVGSAYVAAGGVDAQFDR
jgi:hypothetical protein